MTTTGARIGGLYSPAFEKGSCGFGLIAQMDDRTSHWLGKTAITSLSRLTHRGAIAADGKTGDGCGLLLKKPDGFLRACADEAGLRLGEVYAAGMVFLSQDAGRAETGRNTLAREIAEQGLELSGWRVVPTDADACGEEALKTLPRIEQLYVNAPAGMRADEMERRLFVARRRAEKAVERRDPTFYVPTLSAKLIGYKGLVMADRLPPFYPDLKSDQLCWRWYS